MFLFAVFARATIYAFDIGTQNVRIAVGVPGKPIVIQPNDEGGRKTPNFVAYTPATENLTSAEWKVGSEAQRIIHKNASQGVRNPFQFLANPSGAAFGGLHPVTTASVTFALYLSKFKKKHDKLIVAVPPVFSPQAREALIRSLKLLNISSAQIIDSNAAVASLYAVERLKKGDGVKQKILFADIGAVQSEFSLWEFERLGVVTKITLLDYRYTDQVGGELVDNLLIENITASLGREPTRPEMANIHRQTVRTKERLAAGGEEFVDLSEDFQKRIPLTNEMVSELAADAIGKLKDLIKGMECPDDVELVGGATRLPAFASVIQSEFPNLTLHRSLNSDEAVAFGAAYYSSLQSGTIGGTRLDFHKPSLYGFNFICDGKKYDLYRTGEITERKTVSMRKFRDFNISLELSRETNKNLTIQSVYYDKAQQQYADVALVGLTYMTRNITSQLANGTRPSVRFTFGHSEILDCPDFISASLNVNMTVNVTIEGQTADVNSTTANLPIKTVVELADSEFKVDQSKAEAFLSALIAAAQERRRHDAAAHKIEAFIIDLTDKIEYDSEFKLVTTEEERNAIMQLLQRERMAVDFSASRVSANDLEKRLDKIKEKISDALVRYDEYKGRIPAVMKLNATLLKGEKELANAKCDESTKENFKNLMNECAELIKDVLAIKPDEHPRILVNDIKEKEKQVTRMFTSLRMPPRPAKSISFTNDPSDPNYEKNLKQLKKMGINIVSSPPKDNETSTDNETTPTATPLPSPGPETEPPAQEL